MKIKTFNFPTFAEWKNSSYNRFEIKLGDYRAEVGVICWKSGKFEETYGFAISLANLNPLNIYSDKLFYRNFSFTGNTENFNNWYENTISEFNEFWKEYITETYFEN